MDHITSQINKITNDLVERDQENTRFLAEEMRKNIHSDSHADAVKAVENYCSRVQVDSENKIANLRMIERCILSWNAKDLNEINFRLMVLSNLAVINEWSIFLQELNKSFVNEYLKADPIKWPQKPKSLDKLTKQEAKELYDEFSEKHDRGEWRHDRLMINNNGTWYYKDINMAAAFNKGYKT